RVERIYRFDIFFYMFNPLQWVDLLSLRNGFLSPLKSNVSKINRDGLARRVFGASVTAGERNRAQTAGFNVCVK
ncbi:MAG: hypothetical protein LBO72_02720, partial [Helicobacteraceae bacterium]|nr:hypothetical protein [Helicobacteraceae bacterium]